MDWMPRLGVTGDEWLRGHGFRVHSQPREGVTLWERDGDFFTHDQAMETAAAEWDVTVRDAMDDEIQPL